MGNCLFGGMGDDEEAAIKVIKSDGGVMEFQAPITAGCITHEFPGHALFPSQDLFWKPICHEEELSPGQSYYLLPLHEDNKCTMHSNINAVRQGHVRSKSNSIPYRMSLDYNPTVLKRSYTDVFSRDSNKRFKKANGFWKVKLVICPEQLVEILSEDGTTQELIESIRTVAKCGNGGGISSSSSSSSVAFSDQWSLSSSRNASSDKKDLISLDI